MAEDTTTKRRDIAAELMVEVDGFMKHLTNAATIASRIASAGLTFVDGDFEGVDATGLLHLDAGIVNDAVDQLDYSDSVTPSLVNYMLTEGQSVTFEKMRP